MAVHTGVRGSVLYGTVVVAKVSEFSLEVSTDTTDFRILGDSWNQRVYIGNDATGTITCQWDPSDAAGQIAMKNAALGGTIIALKLYDTATNFWGGNAFITGMSQNVSDEDVVSMEFAFAGDGTAWSYT